METQCQQIMLYLWEHGSITQGEALKEFGIARLASRVNDLKKRGVVLRRSMVNDVSKPTLLRRLKGEKPRPVRYARYFFDDKK